MAYVVASYYVGPMCRYDGSGNTDEATIDLFSDKERAIQYIIDDIQQQIDEDDDRSEGNFADEKRIRKDLEKYNSYTFEETYMYTLRYHSIN